MTYNVEKKKVNITEADASSNENIAKLILEAHVNAESFDDLEDLTSLITPMKKLEYEDQPGIFKRAGRRMRQRLGSPVQSNRFA